MTQINYLEMIKACCKELRLASSLADRAMITEGQSHQEFLYRLFSDEITARKERRIDKLLGEAEVPSR